jgi:hypothetical protein
MAIERNGQLYATITFVGPPLCGKGENLRRIYAICRPEDRSKLVLNGGRPENDGLFWFEVTFPTLVVRGHKLRTQLCTVPGFGRDAARRTSIVGSDALVFVADSRVGRREANRDALADAEATLHSVGRAFAELPLVLQYNFRDHSPEDILSIDELDQDLNPGGAPRFEAVAARGTGVLETYKAIVKRLMMSLRA